MNQYVIYVLISSVTIAMPGPGVILTLSTTMNHGSKKAVPVILGITSGMGVLSVLAASGVGITVSRVPYILDIVKVLGAGYLTYLGLRLFMKKTEIQVAENAAELTDVRTAGLGVIRQCVGRFSQGFFVTLSNPKPIAFFVALFPQFIVLGASYLPQVSFLSATFCVLVVLIHVAYSRIALAIESKIEKGKVLGRINRISGMMFLAFAVALLYSAISKSAGNIE